jgi:hypothetical protein
LCPDLVRRALDRRARAATAADGAVTAAPAANAIDDVEVVEVDVLDRIDVIVAVGGVGSDPAVAATLDAARPRSRGCAAAGSRSTDAASADLPPARSQLVVTNDLSALAGETRACTRRPVLHEDARAREQAGPLCSGGLRVARVVVGPRET